MKLQNLLVKGLCIGLCGIFSALVSAKPLSPIHVGITPSQSVTQGQPVEFTVRATVNMDAENVRIVVSIPSALEVISGELQWQGPLLNGEEKLLHFTAMLIEPHAGVDQDPVIGVQAAVLAPNFAEDQSQASGRLAANAAYVWQTSVSRITASRQTQSVDSGFKESRQVQRNGITLKEYPLRP